MTPATAFPKTAWYMICKRWKNSWTRFAPLFGGQALVEEFVDGREFNTTVIGYRRLIIPAISEIVYTLPPDKPRLLTFESKWQEDSLYYKNTRNVCPAPITPPKRTASAGLPERLSD